MASIDSSSERYRQPVWNSSERSLRSGEVAIKNIVELKKTNKIRVHEEFIQNETSYKLVDGAPNKLIEAIKNKGIK